ncbi:hypothetical protein [Mesorhizobium sp. L48C026A00]|uniref:hypothetical protein n=1 Tax=Mesorhizobium sp. L48C026A00 TaxID=1287182 RepID=UPI0012EC6C27|nr:hypothetical protein [Mesorhizobium sp. L48C026A00]
MPVFHSRELQQAIKFGEARRVSYKTEIQSEDESFKPLSQHQTIPLTGNNYLIFLVFLPPVWCTGRRNDELCAASRGGTALAQVRIGT